MILYSSYISCNFLFTISKHLLVYFNVKILQTIYKCIWHIYDNGDFAFVGQPDKAAGGKLQVGSTKVYAKSPNETYSEVQELSSNITSELEFFGKQVESGDSGHIVAVGATGADYTYIGATAALAYNTGEVDYFINNMKVTGTITGNSIVTVPDSI